MGEKGEKKDRNGRNATISAFGRQYWEWIAEPDSGVKVTLESDSSSFLVTICRSLVTQSISTEHLLEHIFLSILSRYQANDKIYLWVSDNDHMLY